MSARVFAITCQHHLHHSAAETHLGEEHEVRQLAVKCLGGFALGGGAQQGWGTGQPHAIPARHLRGHRVGMLVSVAWRFDERRAGRLQLALFAPVQ